MSDWALVVWTYSILNPAAAGLIAWRSKAGFIVGNIAAVLMIAHGASNSELRGLALMGAIYFVINCIGLWRWWTEPWWKRGAHAQPNDKVVVISGSGGRDGHPGIAVDGKGRLSNVAQFPGTGKQHRRRGPSGGNS